MVNPAKRAGKEASDVLDIVLNTVKGLLVSRKFVLAVAGFVGVIVGVPAEACVPLVAVILAEGAADIKSRAGDTDL